MAQTVVPILRGALTTRPAAEVIPGYDGKGPAAPVEDANDTVATGLAGYVRSCFEAARRHRQSSGIDDRILAAMRAVRGEYDPETLKAIKEFGGSEIYARVVANKARTMSATLREIYTAQERPWGISPTPEADLPGTPITQTVDELLKAEVMEAVMAGAQPDPEVLQQRKSKLTEMIGEQRRKVATDALHRRERVLDDILWEGGFYDALWDFLGDIPLFPVAILKGPVVRMRTVLRWEGRTPVTVEQPIMTWERRPLKDVYFAPWSRRPNDGYIIDKQMVSPSELSAMRRHPSFNPGAIDRLLTRGSRGMKDWLDWLETEMAYLEERESTQSGDFGNAIDVPYPMLEFHGAVKGSMLIDWGADPSIVPDPNDFVEVTAWLIDNEVIGVRRNPHPAGHKPFYVDSFERVPGSLYGNSINDLISDVASVCNATLRALVNNMAIASGPMGWVNEDRLAENDQNDTRLYPWKIWRMTDANDNVSQPPVNFFQPDSNAQELLGVFERFMTMADEFSSLPRIMQGSSQGLGGAGRTASGMSMLMESANRTVKQVVSSIDQTIIESAVEDLNVYVALTRPDIVNEGDLSVKARGAVELVQRETLRMRRLEFLNITANPIDAQIVGHAGRHAVLKEVARDLALPLTDVLPNDPAAMQQAMQAQAQAQAQANGQGQNTPGPGGQQRNPTAGIARPMSNTPGQ